MTPTDDDLSSLIPTLLRIIKEAGARIAHLYTQEDIEVFTKPDKSPVTVADKDSHRILKEGLPSMYPVVSEEDPLSWPPQAPRYWLIDPLDGTKGFIRKTDEFCINIALMENHHPILGMIHLPLTGETFYGYHHQAWVEKEETTTPIHTRAVPPEGMTLLVGSKSTLPEKVLQDYPIISTEVVQSAIKFCFIACGKADVYVRVYPCSEWDTAAGQALVEAAGGQMTQLDGSPFLYGKPHPINPPFVVLGERCDTRPQSCHD